MVPAALPGHVFRRISASTCADRSGASGVRVWAPAALPGQVLRRISAASTCADRTGLLQLDRGQRTNAAA